MSELFNEGPRRTQAPRPSSGRSRALMITAVILILLFIGLTGFSAFWTERLWFGSTGFAQVFSTLLWTRIGLFAAFGLLLAALVGANMYFAYRFRPIFVPAGPDQQGLERYREAITPIRTWLLIGVSVVLGLFAGTSASGEWREYLLWRNGTEFGETDPYFDRDIGFYVFDLPWLHYLVDFVMAAAVVSLIAAALVHYLYGGIRLQARTDRLSGAAQVQLSVLLGIFVLAKAADYFLDRFDLLNDSGGLITGMTFTDANAVLPAKNILMGIAAICALLFFLNVWRRTWVLPSVGLALLVLSSVLLGMLWPSVVQQFQVEPTEADKEAPYIERNIRATRAAYDLDGVVTEPYAATSPLSNEELAQTAIDSPGIRLVDPRLVQPIFEQRQQVRGYYSVAPVLDVDRYDIGGQERDMVLGARELNQDGLPDDAKNWANLNTVYTHGYGLIAAYGNQRPADNSTQVTGDEPAWAETDIPPTGDLTDLTEEGYEGRIYFGERSPTYSVVGKRTEESPDIELDLPSSNDEESAQSTNTYDGRAGVPVGSLFNKLLYAIKFGEPNLVLSGRVHENSKILYDRNPRQMVEKVAPWLIVDEDPFPAVINKRVVWVLDGFTTTDRYPLSERASFDDMTEDALATNTQFQTLPTDEINYMRNAVKATVDAYDGTVTLYAWDEEDPMLQAWSDAFPGTVQSRDSIPEELLSHLRYPEDLFKVQRYQLARYHVEDPADFYEQNDRWEVPPDPDQQNRLQPPYRLSINMPDQGPEPMFSLTSVYTPNNRNNLAAFLSVDADASKPDTYGTLRVLRLSSTTQIQGPSQIANTFAADEGVKRALLPFTQNNSSSVLSGNLLTLPVGERLLYVQPLYTQRTTGEGNFPVLRFVAVSFGGSSVGIGQTLSEAIYDVLGLDPNAAAEPETQGPPGGGAGEQPPTGTVQQQIRTLLSRADAKFVEADAALADGDTVAWARAMEEARALVERAVTLSEPRGGPPAGGE